MDLFYISLAIKKKSFQNWCVPLFFLFPECLFHITCWSWLPRTPAIGQTWRSPRTTSPFTWRSTAVWPVPIPSSRSCEHSSLPTEESALPRFCTIACWVLCWRFGLTAFLIGCRPDMTFAVDWALSNNYLSIYPHRLLCSQLEVLIMHIMFLWGSSYYIFFFYGIPHVMLCSHGISHIIFCYQGIYIVVRYVLMAFLILYYVPMVFLIYYVLIAFFVYYGLMIFLINSVLCSHGILMAIVLIFLYCALMAFLMLYYVLMAFNSSYVSVNKVVERWVFLCGLCWVRLLLWSL